MIRRKKWLKEKTVFQSAIFREVYMKKTLSIGVVLVLSLMFLMYCGGDSVRVSTESFQDSSEDSSEGSSRGTSNATSKPRTEQRSEERETLAAIFDELAAANGERPNMALLGKKYGLSEGEVFDTISKLTAEGKIDTEKSLQSNKKANAALALIENELKLKKSET